MTFYSVSYLCEDHEVVCFSKESRVQSHIQFLAPCVKLKVAFSMQFNSQRPLASKFGNAETYFILIAHLIN